ncbi:MAG: DUF3426 domain-containing protein [Desulfobacteraceae bacterium]|nr:DUF3426 domain-containing protein [Desulfobacteraceae bacterium]
MVITCYSCSTSFNLDESLVKPEGTKVRCSRCKHFFIICPPGEEIVEDREDFSDLNLDSGIGLEKENQAPATGSAVNVESGQDLPNMVLDESEFSYRELTGLKINDDPCIGDDEPYKNPLQGQSDSELRDDESKLEPPDQDMPVLELDMEALALILDDSQIAEDGSDPPEFDMEKTDHTGHTELVRIEEDDPEFELEIEFGRAPDSEISLLEDKGPIEIEETEDVEEHKDVYIDESSPAAIGQTELEKPDLAELDIQGSAVPQNRKFMVHGPVIILIPVLLFFIVAGAYIASLMTGYKIPVISDIKIPYLEKILEKEAPKETVSVPVPNQKNVNGRFVTNTTAGSLFVITGTVENPSNNFCSHIQVKGSLIAKNNKEIKTKLAFCGNIIPEEMLKISTIVDINAALSKKKGTNGSNVNIKPGAFVPYMLVFSNLSDQRQRLQSFTVRVNAYDKK